jgi:signal peptidase I
MKLNSNNKLYLTLISVAIVTISLFQFVIYSGVGTGPSMSPSMSTLTWVIGNRLDFEYNRGDVVVVQPKAWDGAQVVKRILGVPGDKIIVDGVKITINDELIMAGSISTSFGGYPYQEYILGENEYFIVGDNFMNSYDSRARGPVEVSDILAKILFWINL